MLTEILKIEHLKKYFIKKKMFLFIFMETGIAFNSNEILGVVGESGSGKSTIAKLILKSIAFSGKIIFENIKKR